MARLTDEQWREIREKWENDDSSLSQFVANLSIPLTRQAVLKKIKNEGWEKKNGKVTAPQKLQQKVTPVTSGTKPDPKLDETRPLYPAITEAVGLSDREKIFVSAYLSNGMNKTQAAIAAGYEEKSASWTGWNLLRNPKINLAVKNAIQERCAKFGVDADEAFRFLIDTINFDANEFSSYIRYCCPYCNSTNGKEQLAYPEWIKSKEEWDRAQEENGEIEPFPYEVWDKSKDINPECLACNGLGVGEVVFHDTRYLSDIGRALYCGVEKGKDSVKIVLMNKEKARTELLTALGLFRERTKEGGDNALPIDKLEALYKELTKEAEDRQRAVLEERGLLSDGEIIEE